MLRTQPPQRAFGNMPTGHCVIRPYLRCMGASMRYLSLTTVLDLRERSPFQRSLNGRFILGEEIVSTRDYRASRPNPTAA